MDPELLDALRREREGSAELTLVQHERVRLPFSLMGFSAAFRVLDAGPVTP
jgi:invasion protein IalB